MGRFLCQNLQIVWTLQRNNGHKVRMLAGRNEVRKQQLLTAIPCGNIVIDDRLDDASLSSVSAVPAVPRSGWNFCRNAFVSRPK